MNPLTPITRIMPQCARIAQAIPQEERLEGPVGAASA